MARFGSIGYPGYAFFQFAALGGRYPIHTIYYPVALSFLCRVVLVRGAYVVWGGWGEGLKAMYRVGTG